MFSTTLLVNKLVPKNEYEMFIERIDDVQWNYLTSIYDWETSDLIFSIELTKDKNEFDLVDKNVKLKIQEDGDFFAFVKRPGICEQKYFGVWFEMAESHTSGLSYHSYGNTSGILYLLKQMWLQSIIKPKVIVSSQQPNNTYSIDQKSIVIDIYKFK